MGKRGPLPSASRSNVRSIRGNLGHRPAKSAPKAVTTAPRPPAFLDREARAEWARVIKELERLKIVSMLDRAILSAYCSAWSTMVAALKAIDGPLVAGRRGSGEVVKHPALQVYRDSAHLMLLFARELGLTPYSRARMTAGNGPDDDFEDDLD